LEERRPNKKAQAAGDPPRRCFQKTQKKVGRSRSLNSNKGSVDGNASLIGRSVIVRFTRPREGHFVFVVEDEAPLFNPLDKPELPALNPREEIRIGGQGIRLLRRFADALEYEPMPAGNRLRISFSAADSRSDSHAGGAAGFCESGSS
jgi:hypothetical protein